MWVALSVNPLFIMADIKNIWEVTFLEYLNMLRKF